MTDQKSHFLKLHHNKYLVTIHAIYDSRPREISTINLNVLSMEKFEHDKIMRSQKKP